MQRKWSKLDLDFLRANYGESSCAEIALVLGRTAGAVKAKAAVIHLVKRVPWSTKDVRKLIRFYPDTPTPEVCRILNRPDYSVYGKAAKLGLRKSDAYLARKKEAEAELLRTSGKAHRFPKGHVPANKGMCRPGYAPGNMASTQFKKGQRSINWKPPGSTRIDTEGYVLVKVAATGLFQWRFLHQDVWRLHHGRQPKGTCVAFKDGNKLNCEYSNLLLITKAENMLRNSIHHFPAEVIPAMAALADLKKEIIHAEEK